MELFDGNNILYRLCATKAYPLKELMYKVNKPSLPIVVWDGKNALKWRRDLYPRYKSLRGTSELSTTVYTTRPLAQDLLSYVDCLQISVDGYEADDIIAHLAGIYNVDYIHTNDYDLTGLGAPTDSKKDTIEHLRLYKTLVGDSSDNIRGLRMFGQKSWEKLSDYDKRVLEKTLSDPHTFRCYPMENEKLQEKIEEKMTFMELKNIWEIIGFKPITPELLEANISTCTWNPKGIEKIRAEYLLW